MNHTRQFLVELRNTWRVAVGLVGVLVGFFLLQRPDRTVERLAAAGGPEWIVPAYGVAVPTFAAAFVVFTLAAYATVEDTAENVHDRLLVYPASFPKLLVVRALPVAVCGTGAALVLGLVAASTLPALGLTTTLAAVTVVAAATLPLAVLVTLLYLRVDDPRVGTVGVFGVILAVVSLPRYALSDLSLPTVGTLDGGVAETLGGVAETLGGVAETLGGVAETLGVASVGGIVVLYALTAVALRQFDPERIVVR